MTITPECLNILKNYIETSDDTNNEIWNQEDEVPQIHSIRKGHEQYKWGYPSEEWDKKPSAARHFNDGFDNGIVLHSPATFWLIQIPQRLFYKFLSKHIYIKTA